MKGVYKTKSFYRLVMKYGHDYEAIEREWEKEERKLIASLKEHARDDIIKLLCSSYLKNEANEALLITNKEMIEVQEKLIKKLRYSNSKSERYYKGLRKAAFEAVDALQKKTDYLENILEKRDQRRNKHKEDLARARDKRNKDVSFKSKERDAQLEKNIRDYFVAHQGHKVGNKELIEFFTDRKLNFGTDSSFARKVATVAAKIKKESTNQ